MRLKDGQTLVFFGDSITRRSEIKDAADPRVKFSLNYDDSYVDLFLQRLVIHYPKLDLKTYNLGVGGDTVNGLMERFWELESLKPNWVVLCIGQNDAKTLSPAQFQEQLSYLLEQLADLGCKTVQLTTTPCPYSREKDEKLLAVVVEPGKQAEFRDIDSGLEALQGLVGGDIQAIYPYDDPVAIICNDEGKLQGLPFNRALRDESGEIYDIVAGTFAIVGLTDDSFGSLDGDLAIKYANLFKQPEQFAKLGDRIIAIPMISEEQKEQAGREQKDFEVNMDTTGLAVSGHIGTWHTIDHREVDGAAFYLMEHDTFGDDAACIIVDERGKLVLDQVYDGFDEQTMEQLHQEVMPVDRMPDESVTVDDMKAYGYAWGGMLPMREEAAAEVMKSCTVFRLYGDNTESRVQDASELKDHAQKGGLFGVEKVEWKAALERENYLKSAEMSTEDDYGMIDGIINNGSKEDKSAERSSKSSIMDRLKAAKSEPQKDKPTPHKEPKKDREL